MSDGYGMIFGSRKFILPKRQPMEKEFRNQKHLVFLSDLNHAPWHLINDHQDPDIGILQKLYVMVSLLNMHTDTEAKSERKFSSSALIPN